MILFSYITSSNATINEPEIAEILTVTLIGEAIAPFSSYNSDLKQNYIIIKDWLFKFKLIKMLLL